MILSSECLPCALLVFTYRKDILMVQHEITNPNQHDGAQPPCLQTQKQMNSVVVRSNQWWHMIDGLSEWYAQNEVMKQNSE